MVKLTGDQLDELMREERIRVLARSKIAEEHKPVHEEYCMARDFGATAAAARAALKPVSPPLTKAVFCVGFS